MTPGYKQTEVGVIPEEWSVESLDGISDPNRPICYGIVQVGPYSNDGIPVLAIKNLNGDYTTNIHRCSHRIETAYTRSRVRSGDVLVSVKGTIGRIGLVPPHFSGNISRDLARISLTDSDVPAFWYQMLQSDMAQRRLEATTVGTTRMELSIGPLKHVKMPRPLKEEQLSIATILSDVDRLLDGLKMLIAKKRDLKQAVMQQLLTARTRLPGFSGTWEANRLERLVDIRSGGTPSTARPEFWDGDVLWCTPTDVTALNGCKYLSSTNRKISHLGLISSSAELIPARSIVMTSRATIGECAINTVPITTNQGFKNFIPYKFVDIEFLYYLLLTQKKGFKNLCGGSTFLEISKTQLAAYTVSLPPTREEQEAIAAILSDMDAELVTLEQWRAKIHALKQGMMQQLLTGKARLLPQGVSHA
jgi:type I restriction enzyme, S subunit